MDKYKPVQMDDKMATEIVLALLYAAGKGAQLGGALSDEDIALLLSRIAKATNTVPNTPVDLQNVKKLLQAHGAVKDVTDTIGADQSQTLGSAD